MAYNDLLCQVLSDLTTIEIITPLPPTIGDSPGSLSLKLLGQESNASDSEIVKQTSGKQLS